MKRLKQLVEENNKLKRNAPPSHLLFRRQRACGNTTGS
jgi:hypothetical protein